MKQRLSLLMEALVQDTLNIDEHRINTQTTAWKGKWN